MTESRRIYSLVKDGCSTGSSSANDVVLNSRTQRRNWRCCHHSSSLSLASSLLRKKEALLTLFWSLVGFSVFHFAVKLNSVSYVPSSYRIVNAVGACVAALLGPLAGWLVEARFGRHKVTRCSLLLMWASVVVLNLLRVLKGVQVIHVNVPLQVTYSVLILVMLMGLAAFQSSLIQLGMDQLYDASSYEIVSYIILYAWTFSASEILVQLTQVCFCKEYFYLASLVLPTLLSLALCADFLFHQWLVKEPVPSRNPLLLIFKVLSFSVTNRYPRRRSSFSYWGSKRHSRLDLAKDCFGGPFTSEEVEDVKTFLRISIIIGILSILIGVLFHSSNAITKINYERGAEEGKLNCSSTFPFNATGECFQMLAVGNAGEMFVTVFLLLYDFLLLPLLWNCVSRLSILKKSGLGLAVMFTCLLCLLFLQLAKYLHHLHHLNHDAGPSNVISGSDMTTTAMTRRTDAPPTAATAVACLGVVQVSYQPGLIGPSLLAGIGESILLISCITFVSAQSPYAMRGVLFGMVCMGVVFSLFLVYTVISLVVLSLRVESLLQRCSLWFLLASTVVSAVLIAAFFCVSLCYKRRERDANLPSQQQNKEGHP